MSTPKKRLQIRELLLYTLPLSSSSSLYDKDLHFNFLPPNLFIRASLSGFQSSMGLVMVLVLVLFFVVPLRRVSSEPISRADFPDGFVFGTASSAYQSDIDLMKNLRMDAYRFSISWSRIFPNGTGEANPEGVKYYNSLIDALLAKGIKPYVTLYHWDLPQALEDRYEGWLSSKVVLGQAGYTLSHGESGNWQCILKTCMETLLSNLSAAIRNDECDVRGYFVWSLLDNWEWNSGYTVRFGIYYVDYKNNLTRIPKASVRWFRTILDSSSDSSKLLQEATERDREYKSQ